VVKPRVTFITLHFIGSKRRAGSHGLAEAFRHLGWDVTFVTTSFSHLSRLKRDHRIEQGLAARAGRVEHLSPDLHSYIWFTPYHPLNRLPRLLAKALTPVFRGYADLPAPGLADVVRGSDLVIFETTAGLMLADKVRRWAPNARFVYRVADDLQVLRAHPVVFEAERRALPMFDLVSAPSPAVRSLLSALPTFRLHYHAVDRAAFDVPSKNPYPTGVETNAIFVGVAQLDVHSLVLAARALPSWTFHVIGPLSVPRVPNIVSYGELPFLETVPYIIHADVGLGMREDGPGAVWFSDSLKIVQYTYARLPIVVPEVMQTTRAHSFAYVPGDQDSIKQALLAARRFDRSLIDRSMIQDWREIAIDYAGPLAEEGTGGSAEDRP
jgi:2-beta-glucuronyltransferase